MSEIKKLRVGITFNLKKNTASDLPAVDTDAEFDEPETITAIKSVLERAGCAVTLYEATEDLPLRLIREKPDIVFNIAEGINGRGREAQVPAILNYLHIPFTGSDETTMCVAMDKALTKTIAASRGVSTPKFRIVKCGAPLPDIGVLSVYSADPWNGEGAPPDNELTFPVIVKPNAEGSSKGISDLSIVEDAAALEEALAAKISAYKQDMLIEEYIAGREFTAGILGNGDELRVFPPMEIIFTDAAHGIYSYEVKRNFRQFVRYECPPDISPVFQKEIEAAAEKIYRALECRDFARMDFRLSRDGRLYFIEINPLPGLAPEYSDFPMIAAFNGIDYATLIRKILDSALARYGLPYQLASQ
jgi:D-alanine-D-alanine ligase